MSSEGRNEKPVFPRRSKSTGFTSGCWRRGAEESTRSQRRACSEGCYPPVRLREWSARSREARVCEERSGDAAGRGARRRKGRAGQAWEGHRAASSTRQGRRPRRGQGKIKFVSENYTGNYPRPSSGYVCHVAADTYTFSYKRSHFRAFELSQKYLYELSGNAVIK